MSIEEAIKHCEEVAAGETEQGKCPECAADHKQLAEWLRELVALRAQQSPIKLDRSRWEGCHACESECCELCIYKYSDVGEPPCSSCINGNMELTNYKPKPFCDKCGRPLTEEAWAELERRIK